MRLSVVDRVYGAAQWSDHLNAGGPRSRRHNELNQICGGRDNRDWQSVNENLRVTEFRAGNGNTVASQAGVSIKRENIHDGRRIDTRPCAIAIAESIAIAVRAGAIAEVCGLGRPEFTSRCVGLSIERQDITPGAEAATDAITV